MFDVQQKTGKMSFYTYKYNILWEKIYIMFVSVYTSYVKQKQLWSTEYNFFFYKIEPILSLHRKS